MSKTFDETGLRRRLDAMILLLLEIAPSGAESVTRKIERLLGFGFSPAEVAQIIGKPANYVTAVTAGKRKAAGKGKDKA
jgi:hypothetical protein